MTRFTLSLAAALLAGTTLTSAANAGGIRVGFGFPLGSFIAHSAQNYPDDGYARRQERRHTARRTYQADAAPARKIKRASKPAVAAARPASPPAVQTAKLEDRLTSNPATTTEIAKTSNVSTASVTPAEPATVTPASNTATTETKTTTVAAADKPEPVAKAKTPASDAKQVCRRYSAAIAGLIDVPCGE